jgi:hypothetical protein
MLTPRANRLSVVLLGVSVLALSRLGAQGAEIVQGRVVNLVHQPIHGVEVTIIVSGSGSTVTTHTDAKGQFNVVFHEIGPGYTIRFRGVGVEPFVESITPNGPRGAISVGDVTLAGSAQKLTPLTTTGARRQIIPPQAGTVQPLTGGTFDATGAGRFLQDPSDLNALVSQVAGIVGLGDSGYSALGARGGENKVTVDGSEFGSTQLPRDAIGAAALTVNSADPANGQFSGANLAVLTRAGGARFAARLRSEIIDPHLAWADPDAQTSVPHTWAASGFLSGPLVTPAVTAFFSFDGRLTRMEVPSLRSPRQSLLNQYGVAADSVTQLLNVLASGGIPTGGPSPLTQSGADRLTANLRMDYRVNPVTSFTLNASGNWSRLTGSGLNEFALPTATLSSHSDLTRFQFTGSTFTHRILETAHLSVTSTSGRSGPDTFAPGGTVIVGTSFDSERTGLSSLRFGGGGGTTATASGTMLDFNNEISWTEANLVHQVKFTQEVRHDALHQAVLPGAGLFTFQSLEDLAAGTPSSFFRQLDRSGYDANATTTAFSIGDLWRTFRGKLEFQGGIRYDRRSEGPAARYNGSVDSAFGLRTDLAPADGGWSPRLGVSWHPGKPDRRAPFGYVTVLPSGGRVARGMSTPSVADGVVLLAPDEPLIINANFGAYRSLMSPSRIGTLGLQTGLSDATRYLTCIGPAVPPPDWSGATVPTTCAGGSAATPFAETQPQVVAFAPDFQSPVSWRSNIEVSGLRIGGWGVAPSATLSLGRNVESDVNLNLRRSAVFLIGSEANRPVFAPSGMIVPSTGLFAPDAGALNSAFGTVTQVRSDLDYRDVQFLIAIVPPKPRAFTAPFYLTYALNLERSTVRGFNGTTAGDPFSTETIDGPLPVHQLSLVVDHLRAGWFTSAIRLTLRSGVAYTPIVANDINGDGRANDRAFIFDPSTLADTSVAHQVNALLAGASSNTRQCLLDQIGRIAGANSCHTPWQAQIDLALDFSPPAEFALGDRFRLITHLLNASGALVRLFGLENTPLGRSATSQFVDPRLYYVTGFNPQTNGFTYRVNQLFGQPIDFGSSRHVYPPFELQLGVEYRFGYPGSTRSAFDAPLTTSKDDITTIDRVVAAQIRHDLGGNPLDSLLASADSLHLTLAQRQGIGEASRAFNAAVDSLAGPILQFVERDRSHVTRNAILQRETPLQQSWRQLVMVAWVQGTSFLTAEQRTSLTPLGIVAPR